MFKTIPSYQVLGHEHFVPSKPFLSALLPGRLFQGLWNQRFALSVRVTR